MMRTQKIVFGALAGAGLLAVGLTNTASADTYVVPAVTTVAQVYTPGYAPAPVVVPQPTYGPPIYVPYPTYIPYPTYVPAPVYPTPVYVEPARPLFDFSFGFGGHWQDHDWNRGHGGRYGGRHR